MRTVFVLLAACWAAANPALGVEAIEIGAGNVKDLPGGREADGIIGDFVLRNDLVEVVISGNQPRRKANMATQWGHPTPGCIYDFSERGRNNDQLTWFGPGGQRGQLSRVFVASDGSTGEAVVRAELSAAAGDGLARAHEYSLRDGRLYVVVTSEYRNTTGIAATITPAAEWSGLTGIVKVGDVVTGLCQDPDDRVGYAYGPVEDDKGALPAKAELPAGATARYRVALAIGRGSAEAFGVLQNQDHRANGFDAKLVDPAGGPVRQATVLVNMPGADKPLTAYADDEGRYRLSMRGASYQAIVRQTGRADLAVTLERGGPTQTIELPPFSGAQVQVTDSSGAGLPCKAQFIPLDEGGSPKPAALNLGPTIRARGCDNLYFSENGRFTQGLPPGRYQVVITRGIEYTHDRQAIDVAAGQVVPVRATLTRMVETPGWVSTDFHNHTTLSGDNYCGLDDRLINLAAEGVEFAPTTEHNRIDDWRPHIERLGLAAQLATVSGIELTGGGPHLNAFPLIPVPNRQDNGGPEWNPDARVSALTLRQLPGDASKRWVQLNHPDLSRFFNDFDGDRKPDGGFRGLEMFINGAETWGEDILTMNPRCRMTRNGQTVDRENRPFAWLQMLNAGLRIWTVAVSDAHQVARGGVGGWRTYVRCPSDDPPAINPREIIDNAKAGRSFVTNGPFLEVSTAKGQGPGSTIKGVRDLELRIAVRCTSWIDVNRVVVLVNGRIRPELDFRRGTHSEYFSGGGDKAGESQVPERFTARVPITLDADAHLIVVAIGEGLNLKTGYGESWQAAMQPIAYHNPIFVDVDGNGFTPNRDTLGHPYLTYGRAGQPPATRPAQDPATRPAARPGNRPSRGVKPQSRPAS